VSAKLEPPAGGAAAAGYGLSAQVSDWLARPGTVFKASGCQQKMALGARVW
jgi:hypothetical protein